MANEAVAKEAVAKEAVASYVQVFVDPCRAVVGVGGVLSANADARLGDIVVSHMIG